MSFIDDFNTRKRAVTALLSREAKKRFGNSMIGLLAAFLEPAVQVLFFGLIFYATGKEGPHGSDVFVFMITGVLPYHLFSKMFDRSTGALDANKTLLSYPILKPIDPIAARSALEAMIYLSTYVIMMAVCLHLGWIDQIARVEYVLQGLLLAGVLGLGAGILSAALFSLHSSVKKIVPIIIRAGFLTSGVFFSVSMLPQFARDYMLWNPMLNVSEVIRYGTFGNYPGSYFDLTYVWFVALILLTAGLLTLGYAEKSPKAKIRGSS